MRRLVALVACLAIAGCGGSDDANKTPTQTVSKVDAKVPLDRTIQALDRTTVHLTEARTDDSIPGVELPDAGKTDVWIVVDMTVTAERRLDGSALRSEMSLVGAGGESTENEDAEKALPNGLVRTKIQPRKPADVSVVFLVGRAFVSRANFSYAGDIVPLGL